MLPIARSEPGGYFSDRLALYRTALSCYYEPLATSMRRPPADAAIVIPLPSQFLMPHTLAPDEADALFLHTSDGILLLDRDGSIRSANSQAERLFRLKADALEAMAFWTLAQDARTSEAAEVIERATTRGLSGRFEVFYPGLYAWHAVTVVPVRDGAMLFIRDITDRMRLLRDEAVRQGIADVIAIIPVAISVTRGPEHRFEIVNAFAREVLGGRDVVGLTLRNAFPELVDQGFPEIFDTVYDTGKPYEAAGVRVRFRRGLDQELSEGTFDIVYQPLRDLNGEINGILTSSVERSLD